MEEDKMMPRVVVTVGAEGGVGGAPRHSTRRRLAQESLSPGLTDAPFGHHLEKRQQAGLPLIQDYSLPRSNSGDVSRDCHRTYFSGSSCRSGCRRSGVGGKSGSAFCGLRWPLPLRTLWVCFLWVLFTTPSNTCADSNGCDFYGSGLEQDGRGVQPVYLSCSSGRVEWQYPRAGLRVILKSPHKEKDFHACVKADKKFEGARIYLEGHRSLLPLYAPDDGRPRDLVRCFTSYKGQAALYVEAEQSTDDLKKQVAAFEYDLQSIAKGTVYDPLEECRPCTEEELLRLYCSADFVAKGAIVNVEDNSKMSHTTITIKASKIFQQTSPVFRHSSALKKEAYQSHVYSQKSVYEDFMKEEPMGNSLIGESGYLGHVNVPIECGAREGEGEFLVMGVMRLGQPILKCAPRHSEWVKLSKVARSRAQCVIET